MISMGLVLSIGCLPASDCLGLCLPPSACLLPSAFLPLPVLSLPASCSLGVLQRKVKLPDPFAQSRDRLLAVSVRR